MPYIGLEHCAFECGSLPTWRYIFRLTRSTDAAWQDSPKRQTLSQVRAVEDEFSTLSTSVRVEGRRVLFELWGKYTSVYSLVSQRTFERGSELWGGSKSLCIQSVFASSLGEIKLMI